MTGIKTYTNTSPNVHRFPTWKEYVFYPAGSFVAYPVTNILDSEDITFSYYVSITDVPYIRDSEGQSITPVDSDKVWVRQGDHPSNPWQLAFDTSIAALSATLEGRIDALTGLFPLLGIDSDLAKLRRKDSDLTVHDSEQDSDILKGRHDAWAWDSDRDSEVQRRQDSDRHDFKAADSDLQIQIWDNDSDILMEIHDRKSSDSDLQIQIWDNDSDILKEIHDRLSLDSDRDSDFRVLHFKADSDSDRLSNFMHTYYQRDSDIESKFDDHDSDIDWLRYNLALGGGGAGGFPLGAILPFAHMTMPPGFAECNGDEFDILEYPALYAALGKNTLPDLRGAYIKGWSLNTEHDPQGPRPPGDWRDIYPDYDTIASPGNPVNDSDVGPRDMAVLFGIAMYKGAGAILDSDIMQGIMDAKVNRRFADMDSDFNALYGRTGFHTETYAPSVASAPGRVYTVSVNTEDFDDIEVLLNGVQITQWTASGSDFTLNFALRANTDVVVFKLRR